MSAIPTLNANDPLIPQEAIEELKQAGYSEDDVKAVIDSATEPSEAKKEIPEHEQYPLEKGAYQIWRNNLLLQRFQGFWNLRALTKKTGTQISEEEYQTKFAPLDVSLPEGTTCAACNATILNARKCVRINRETGEVLEGFFGQCCAILKEGIGFVVDAFCVPHFIQILEENSKLPKEPKEGEEKRLPLHPRSYEDAKAFADKMNQDHATRNHEYQERQEARNAGNRYFNQLKSQLSRGHGKGNERTFANVSAPRNSPSNEERSRGGRR